MKLESARIQNFKLIEDVTIHFSTDAKQPLTVIRAENGSGKTSVLHALRWAMWGTERIPRQMRLTSTANPPEKPVEVKVQVEFSQHDPHSGTTARYRLIRSCQETPRSGDDYDRSPDRVRLFELTDRGDDEISTGVDGMVSAMLPHSLADVFFTNGDDVQSFITGGERNGRERQKYVHDTIRQLLRIDSVDAAQKIIKRIGRRFRRAVARSGGQDMQNLEQCIEELEDRIESLQKQKAQITDRIGIVDAEIHTDTRELDGIKGIGDLNTIRNRIAAVQHDIDDAVNRETGIRQRMKDILESERLSQRMIRESLDRGLAVLDQLVDMNIIPGIAAGILEDRIELGKCICGTDLNHEVHRRAHIERLIAEQRDSEPRIHRLTELRYRARAMETEPGSWREVDGSGSDTGGSLLDDFREARRQQQAKELDMKAEKDRLSRINESRVQELSSRIHANEQKQREYNQQLGMMDFQIGECEDDLQRCRVQLQTAKEQHEVSRTQAWNERVADDMHLLASGIIETLQSDYVRNVSSRMNDMFLEIVGADISAEAALYTGVTIDSTHNVVIHVRGGRTLDAANELNGASQRALTLSLIWALMEVAQQEAPRIIDTPLGMTSGAVKRRMVETITEPTDEHGVPYQVILFMTRSELNGVEALLDERAGSISTLSCSKDYPVDLVNDWNVDRPVVRTCPCTHREVCRQCMRQVDRLGGLVLREEMS